MRPLAILVVTTICTCSVALVGPVTAQGATDVSMMMPTSTTTPAVTTGINLGGQTIIGKCEEGNFQGFYYEPRGEYFRPVSYEWYSRMNAVPTADEAQAELIADYSFLCFSPRESYLNAALGSWMERYGGGLRTEKWVVRSYCTIYESNGVDEYGHLRRGRVVAGPFQGIGKESTTTDWRIFIDRYAWAHGLNLSFGRSETGPERLQFQATVESLKNLKPVSGSMNTIPDYLR